MIYQKFDTDISKISTFTPTIRYDISISNRYFDIIDISKQHYFVEKLDILCSLFMNRNINKSIFSILFIKSRIRTLLVHTAVPNNRQEIARVASGGSVAVLGQLLLSWGSEKQEKHTGVLRAHNRKCVCRVISLILMQSDQRC